MGATTETQSARVRDEELRMPAVPQSVGRLRGLARQWATAAGLSQERACDLALAVTEAATNAVVHAFTDRDPGHVTLTLSARDGQAVACVRDDGRGLSPRVDSPGLGLGLPTIGRLADHLDVGLAPEGGTEVRMVFDAPSLATGEGLRERLAAAYGRLRDIVLVHDEDGRFLYANAAGLAYLGVATLEELATRVPGETAARYVITLPDGTAPALEDWPHRRVFAGEENPAPLLARSVERTSGRWSWTETSATPISDPPTGRRLSLSVTRDVTEATEAARRARLLAEAGRRLSLAADDLEGTFAEIAALAVPELADWCAVDVADAAGVLRRVALAHPDPTKAELGRRIHDRWPPDPATDEGAYAVLRSGEPLFVPDLDPAMLDAVEDPEHRAALLQLEMRSVLLAPLHGRTAVVGVLTLVSADSGRAFGEDLVPFAVELAGRAGIAVENARLIGERGR